MKPQIRITKSAMVAKKQVKPRLTISPTPAALNTQAFLALSCQRPLSIRQMSGKVKNSRVKKMPTRRSWSFTPSITMAPLVFEHFMLAGILITSLNPLNPVLTNRRASTLNPPTGSPISWASLLASANGIIKPVTAVILKNNNMILV